jgi:hypothetical protein
MVSNMDKMEWSGCLSGLLCFLNGSIHLLKRVPEKQSLSSYVNGDKPVGVLRL